MFGDTSGLNPYVDRPKIYICAIYCPAPTSPAGYECFGRFYLYRDFYSSHLYRRGRPPEEYRHRMVQLLHVQIKWRGRLRILRLGALGAIPRTAQLRGSSGGPSGGLLISLLPNRTSRYVDIRNSRYSSNMRYAKRHALVTLLLFCALSAYATIRHEQYA